MWESHADARKLKSISVASSSLLTLTRDQMCSQWESLELTLLNNAHSPNLKCTHSQRENLYTLDPNQSHSLLNKLRSPSTSHSFPRQTAVTCKHMRLCQREFTLTSSLLIFTLRYGCRRYQMCQLEGKLPSSRGTLI